MTKTRRAHLLVLRHLFTRLTELQLKLNRDKCVFMVHVLKWLGYIISAEGVRPDPAKVKELQRIPSPKTRKELRGFLQMARWHLQRFGSWFLQEASKGDLWRLTSEGSVRVE